MLFSPGQTAFQLRPLPGKALVIEARDGIGGDLGRPSTTADVVVDATGCITMRHRIFFLHVNVMVFDDIRNRFCCVRSEKRVLRIHPSQPDVLRVQDLQSVLPQFGSVPGVVVLGAQAVEGSWCTWWVFVLDRQQPDVGTRSLVFCGRARLHSIWVNGSTYIIRLDLGVDHRVA